MPQGHALPDQPEAKAEAACCLQAPLHQQTTAGLQRRLGGNVSTNVQAEQTGEEERRHLPLRHLLLLKPAVPAGLTCDVM